MDYRSLIYIFYYLCGSYGYGFWFYWMFYDHFSGHSLLAKLGRSYGYGSMDFATYSALPICLGIPE